MAPVAPRPVTEPDGTPLGRSGLDLRGLLAEPDELVQRSKTPAVALDVGLEQARGAFVRNQPADALTLLDAVWEGAKGLETGWYLRGSSLALLGLPGEADRLAEQALELLPQSVAMRFLQSVARLSLGDLSGALAALLDASGRKPADVLLQVHEALLIARQGDGAGAERLMREALVQAPDHPAVAWGRTMLRQALREGARVFEDPSEPSLAWMRTPSRALTPVWMRSIDGADAAPAAGAAPVGGGDAVTQALRQLGSRLADLTPEEAIAECRVLAGSLSAGGTIAAAASAARAHAARSVLGAIIDAMQPATVARGMGWEAQSIDGHWQRTPTPSLSSAPIPDTLQATVRILVAALREGRMPDAEGILRRANGAVETPALSLLNALADAGRQRPTPSGMDAVDAGAIDRGSTGVRGGEPNGSLTALRLGLGLLPTDEALRAGDAAALGGARRIAELDATRGWGAAQAASGLAANTAYSGPSAGVAAMVIAAIALVAFYSAHPFVAVAGLLAAGWLLMRRTNARRAERAAWGETRR